MKNVHILNTCSSEKLFLFYKNSIGDWIIESIRNQPLLFVLATECELCWPSYIAYTIVSTLPIVFLIQRLYEETLINSEGEEINVYLTWIQHPDWTDLRQNSELKQLNQYNKNWKTSGGTVNKC